MKYAGITYNDIVNCPGIAVSVYLQGCPIHCPGCHNSSIWDFDGGKELTQDVIDKIIEAISANGISRSLCILGGEPLANENIAATAYIIEKVRNAYPDIKIYLWTGYTLETLNYQLKQPLSPYIEKLSYIFNTIDYMIDGPFIQDQRDVSLFMRGSSNQRIIDMKTKQFIDNIEKL